MADLREDVITLPEELPACCEHLSRAGRFGFDTEFVGEDTYHPRLCLIQVATADRLFLIDPLTVGSLDPFWGLVTDPANLVIVHAGREEVRMCHLWSGQLPGNLFDLQIAAGIAGFSYPLSHAALVGHLLKVQLAKGETLTEWRKRPLTQAQLRYAFDDVRYLLALWEAISGRLQRLERTEWAKEEFQRMAGTATADEPVVARWRKLRGLGSLDKRRLAIVRALYQWREEVAARTNRPARTIVRDDLIIEIARRNPARERDLHVVRGLPKRDLEAIVQVVEAARAIPLDECPAVAEREQDPPQVGLVCNVLMAVLGDLCSRLGVAPNLVATSQDIKLLARSRQQGSSPPADLLLTQGWRARHILPTLLAVLEGRRSLRIADVSVDNPFAFQDVE
jgi:ribonuclease D